MEKDFIQTFETVEDMLPAVKDLIVNYCIDNEVDEKNIHPTLWNDILDEINTRIVKPNIILLKTINNINNQYDRSKVIELYSIYKKICNKYVQEISISGFNIISGIDKQTFYNWESAGPSAIGFDFRQKIMEDNEQSLTALMIGDKGIPTKYLAKLNRYHGWNMPGVTRETSKRQSLGAAELPKLGIHNAENTVLPSDCTIVDSD